MIGRTEQCQRRRPRPSPWLPPLLLIGMLTAVKPAVASSAFTYQGSLRLNGAEVTATCQMRFRLFDQLAAGSQVGSTIGPQEVSVDGGLFIATLDFGGAALGTGNRWVEVAVDCGGGLIVLAPRQALTAEPYAYYADKVGDGGVGASQIQDNAITSAKISDGSITAADIDSTTVQRRVTGNCPSGAIGGINADGTVACVVVGDITGVTAGNGLTGGGSSGSVSLAVDFSGSGSTSKVSRADHDHVGQAWSGGPTTRVFPDSPIPILQATHTATNGIGLQGRANTGSAARGVEGSSVDGTGVQGTGAVGVLGSSTAGTGVKGTAASSGQTGVFGQSTGSGGNGVEGIADVGSSAYGVWGRSQQGFGVVGSTNAAAEGGGSGPAGVQGSSSAQSGVGVRGIATAQGSVGVNGSGGNTGVFGEFNGSGFGIGVSGSADDGEGASGSSVTGTGVEASSVVIHAVGAL